jgi:hypothetical protein
LFGTLSSIKSRCSLYAIGPWLIQRNGTPRIVDLFVTLELGWLSHIAMSPAPKALAHGMLTFLEITIVVLVVISLAAIASLSALGSRKRNRALENANAPHLMRSATDRGSG